MERWNLEQWSDPGGSPGECGDESGVTNEVECDEIGGMCGPVGGMVVLAR